jgi:hypothetical protein
MAKRKGKKSKSSTLTDPMAEIMYVLRDSNQEHDELLKYYAEKIRRMNEISRAIRELLKVLREFRSTLMTSARKLRLDLCRGDQETQAELANLMEKHAHPYEVSDLGYELCFPDQIPPNDVQDLDALDAAIGHWENELATVEDDAQLAKVDLQNTLQMMVQTMQMMRTFSKALHD